MNTNFLGKSITKIRLPASSYSRRFIEAIPAQQGDTNSRFISASLFDDRGDIYLGIYTKVLLTATYPDGTIYGSDGVLSEDGYSVVCEITPEMLSRVGKLSCDILFYGKDSNEIEQSLTSHTFYVYVSKSQAYDDSIIGSEKLPIISKILIESEELFLETKTSANEAKTASADSKNSANEAKEAADIATENAAIAEQARIEAEEHTLSHVHKWLDEHPEATTTVQNGALTEEKFSEDLKSKTIKEYVTPEMFGYVAGQGLDAADYIQEAIDTGKPCILYGEYTIYRPIYLIGNYHQLIIEGRLNVRGQCGIILTGSYNVIGGNGEIFVMGKAENDFESVSAIQILLSQGGCVENDITVKRILNNPEQNTNVGIEITGAKTYGSGCFDIITSALKYFSKGIWCHKSEGQHADSWYTSLQINSIIQECIQAVVIDWDCGGSYLRGEIQSVYNGATILPANFDTSTPIVKVGSHWTINTFFWDMGTQGEANQSANLYAVEVTGRHCFINSPLDRNFFKIPFELEEYTCINGNYATRDIGVMTRPDFAGRRMNAFDNSNDVLLNCVTNPNVITKLAVTGDGQGDDIYSVIRETSGWCKFFDGTNTQENISKDSSWDRFNFLFEFTEPKSIRTVALWGDTLPDEISVEIATIDNPAVFTEVGVLTAGKDYFSGANYGQYNVAVYSLTYNQLGDLSARNIVALKIKLTVSSTARITRISAFDVAPVAFSDGWLSEAKFTSALQSKMKFLDTYVTPEMFGAKGGGTNDTEALQAAIDSGKPVYMGKNSYVTYKTLTISNPNTTIRGEGTINYQGTGEALLITTYGVQLDLDAISASNGSGIRVEPLSAYVERCKINIRRINAGRYGLHLYTESSGMAYNDFNINYINAKDVCVYVDASDGYINENRYHIGKITGCNVGVFLHSSSTTNNKGGYGTNDNKFYDVGFEGIKDVISDNDSSSPTYGMTDTCAIYLDRTHGNVFRNCRMQEGYGNKIISFSDSCNRNDIELSDFELSKVDISKLASEVSFNTLRATRELWCENFGRLGKQATVSGDFGMSYNLNNKSTWKRLTADLFIDNVIKPIDNVIVNEFTIADENLNGLTFTLHPVYSAEGSDARGCPIVIYFGSQTRGLVKILDSLGNVVVDHSDGKYAYQTVSIRWIGYDRERGRNLWDVQPFSPPES